MGCNESKGTRLMGGLYFPAAPLGRLTSCIGQLLCCCELSSFRHGAVDRACGTGATVGSGFPNMGFSLLGDSATSLKHPDCQPIQESDIWLVTWLWPTYGCRLGWVSDTFVYCQHCWHAQQPCCQKRAPKVNVECTACMELAYIKDCDQIAHHVWT